MHFFYNFCLYMSDTQYYEYCRHENHKLYPHVAHIEMHAL